MTLQNFQMENMLESLSFFLTRTDEIGYVAARNTRILKDALNEYFIFKDALIRKYGETDKYEEKELSTISIHTDSPNFKLFAEEFNKIRVIEQDVDIMKLKYDEVIGKLSGYDILKIDFMLED